MSEDDTRTLLGCFVALLFIGLSLAVMVITVMWFIVLPVLGILWMLGK